MPLKIFVMDDEESIRISLKWHLEELGHQVITAARPHLSGMLPGHLCGLVSGDNAPVFVQHNRAAGPGLFQAALYHVSAAFGSPVCVLIVWC